MVVIGEVHTGLLQHSTAVSAAVCDELLNLLRGDRVRRFERPVAHASSPELLTGVDCELPAANGSRVRGIGTVAARALLTGGHVLQGSAYCRIVSSPSRRRMPWSHYLARPGAVEAIGKYDAVRGADGFCAGGTGTAALDLASVSGRVLDRVQAHPRLDRRAPFRSRRTRLRWAAAEGPAAIALSVGDAVARTVRLTTPDDDVHALAALCEDIALHDWLLTLVLDRVGRARIGGRDHVAAVSELRPVIDHMLHLWMPAARLDGAYGGLWNRLERTPGFSRQWNALVARIRDQMMLATIASTRGESAGPGDRGRTL